MAAGDQVQKGEVVEVGFDGHTYTGWRVSGVTGPTPEADEVSLTDERDATATVILVNPRKTIEVTGHILNSAGAALDAIDALIAGSTFTIKTVGYRLLSGYPQINRGKRELMVTLRGVKEDSMTYT